MLKIQQYEPEGAKQKQVLLHTLQAVNLTGGPALLKISTNYY